MYGQLQPPPIYFFSGWGWGVLTHATISFYRTSQITILQYKDALNHRRPGKRPRWSSNRTEWRRKMKRASYKKKKKKSAHQIPDHTPRSRLTCLQQSKQPHRSSGCEDKTSYCSILLDSKGAENVMAWLRRGLMLKSVFSNPPPPPPPLSPVHMGQIARQIVFRVRSVV